MRKIFSISVALSAFVALSACSVGPNYIRPELELPEKWRVSFQEASAVTDTAWWAHLNDEELNQLIKAALEQNNDIRAAAARVERFYALHGIARSEFFPQLSADASYARRRFSQNGFDAVDPALRGSGITSYYVAEGVLNWELDIWGRIRRATEATRADILAEEAARRGVLLTVVSEVASTYSTLRDLDKRLAITRSTLESRQHSLKLAQDRVNAGNSSELDLRQAESDYYSVQALIPTLEFQITQTENLLSVLTGANPQPIRRGKAIDQLLLAGSLPADLPVTLIEQRPDIIQAEQSLHAANARIGVAQASYLPTISLTGALGLVSSDLSNWLRSSSRQWQYGPGADLPIFNAGRVSNEVRAARAQTEEALARYKNTVQNALREVENALIGFQKTGEQLGSQSKQVAALEKYLGLSQQRYDEGQSSYLEVLDAQRNLFSAELSLVQTEGDRLEQYIAIFRALGGGWIAEAEKLTPEPGRESSWVF